MCTREHVKKINGSKCCTRVPKCVSCTHTFFPQAGTYGTGTKRQIQRERKLYKEQASAQLVPACTCTEREKKMTQVVAFNQNETENSVIDKSENSVIDKSEWPQSPDDGIWRKDFPLENGAYKEKELYIVFVTKQKPTRAFAAMRDLKSIFSHSLPKSSINFISGTPGEPGFIVKGFWTETDTTPAIVRASASLTEVDKTNLRIGIRTIGWGIGIRTISTEEREKINLSTYTFEGIGPIDKDGSHCWSRVCIVSNIQKLNEVEKCIRTYGVCTLHPAVLVLGIILPSILSPYYTCSREYPVKNMTRRAAKQLNTYFEEWDYNVAPQTVVAQIDQIARVLKNSSSPMQAPEGVEVPDFDVFISHDWGKDENGTDNHERCVKIAKQLEEMGLRVFIDEVNMQGNIYDAISRGIDRSRCIMICITKRYMEKVNGNDTQDNCRLEFDYALDQKPDNILPVIMESDMADRSDWTGRFKMRLGNRLFKILGDPTTDEKFYQRMVKIYAGIEQVMAPR